MDLGRKRKTGLVQVNSGIFNAYNLLGVYCIALPLGRRRSRSASSTFQTKRCDVGDLIQVVHAVSPPFIGLLAHTPDALENVLKTILKSGPEGKHLITVVGCGGNRDKTKRPVMAQTASCQLSDRVIFTSRQPKGWRSIGIIQEWKQGLALLTKENPYVADRRAAIFFKNSLQHLAEKEISY